MRDEYNKAIFIAAIEQPAAVRTMRSAEYVQFVLAIKGSKNRV